MRFGRWILCGVVAGLSLVGAASRADAGASLLPGADFSVACENGVIYRLSSGAVAPPGDIVTAYLYLTPRHALPVRLMPMGMGYRYAGRGVWLDGIREHALLYLSKYRPLACIVSHA
jgi:hypothetical protein